MVGMAMEEEEKRKKRVLPINQYEGPILDAIANNTVVVIIGDTGSGKTTQLAQILYRAGYTANGIVAVTQPRRVAAVSVARYAQGTIQRHSDSPSQISLPSCLPLFLIFPSIKHISVCGGFQGLKIIRLKQMLCCCTDR